MMGNSFRAMVFEPGARQASCMELEPRDARVLKAVGMRIRLARTERGWSQEELAHQAGIRHQSLISPLERGQTRSRLDMYVRIARALDLPLEQLFGGLDEKT